MKAAAKEYLIKHSQFTRNAFILTMSEFNRPDGTRNDLYYSKHVTDTKNAMIKELALVKFKDNANLKKTKLYISLLSNIRKELIEFYIEIEKLNRDFNGLSDMEVYARYNNNLQMQEFEIFEAIKRIEYQVFIVRDLVSKGNMDDAALMKQITKDRIEKLYHFFDVAIGIELEQSVFGERMTKLIKKLNKIIPSSEEYKYIKPDLIVPKSFINLNNQDKNLIAHKLVGENTIRTTSIVYHHINDILSHYDLSNIEAREILLEMMGSFSNEKQNLVVVKIIEHLEKISMRPKKQSLVKYLNESLFFNYKNETNIDKHVTPKNWKDIKEIFYKQRLRKYPASYTNSEKNKCELEALEKIVFTKTDLKILKERYKTFLNRIDFEPVDYKPDFNESDLSVNIANHFSFLLGNCPRKGMPILKNEKDLSKLVNWLTYFFENNFKVPEIKDPIKKVNTNDYFTQLAFLYLFDELRIKGFHNQRTRAKTLFKLWEYSFKEYKGYSKPNFWKVKHENGKEVKKLMLID